MNDARKINALVAEHLFGYTDVGQHDTTYWYGRRPGSNILEPIDDYSTTWEGLGMVIERMRELGWTGIVYSYPCRHQPTKLYPMQPDPLPPFRAVFVLDREPWTRTEEYADTASLAASLAR